MSQPNPEPSDVDFGNPEVPGPAGPGTAGRADGSQEALIDAAVSEQSHGTEPAIEVDMTAELVRQLDERTVDLQRLQAEYVNYRRRVERDREAVRVAATVNVLTGMLVVLDDVERARQHGELTGGFKAVADSLERTMAGLGLERFGEVGEAFDPRVHEALSLEYSDEVQGPTATAIIQPGYRVGDRVLRPARVIVTEPNAAPQPGNESAPGPDTTVGSDDVSPAPTVD